MININNISPMYSDFEQIKKLEEDGQEYFSATMTSDVAVRSMESTILLYKGVRGKAQVQVIFDTNTFWLSQQRMAELFGVTIPNIVYHLQQIEASGEIHLSDAIKKILIPSDKWLYFRKSIIFIISFK